MKFTDFLKPLNEATLAGDIASVDTKLNKGLDKRKLPKSGLISEDTTINLIVQLFKKNDMKIKLISPSPFGLQVDFFKPQKVDDIKTMIDTLDIKYISVKAKGNIIFIEL